MHARIIGRGAWAGAAVVCFTGCNESTKPAAYVPDKTYGQYLVEHVADCAGCHSQTDNMGRPIPGLEYAGGIRFDVPPFGAVYSRNITPDHVTGIGHMTDQEIIDGIKLQGLIIFCFSHCQGFAKLDAQAFCRSNGANKGVGFGNKSHFSSDIHG